MNLGGMKVGGMKVGGMKVGGCSLSLVDMQVKSHYQQ